jgi:hypothetical protein
MGCHMRWHVKRGIVRDECEFCISPPTETSKERKARKKAAKRAARAKQLEDHAGPFFMIFKGIQS